MAVASIIGLVLGFGSIIVAAEVRHANLALLYQKYEALVHVLGGTLGAAFLSFPLDTCLYSLREGFTIVLFAHKTPTYPTNCELSTSRAVAVTRHLSEHDGIAPNRLAAIGFAEWHPFVPNTSQENRLLNRRVDIAVMRFNE